MDNRHEKAEVKQSRQHPSGKYDFEGKPDCGGEGWYRNEKGELVVCEGRKCH